MRNHYNSKHFKEWLNKLQQESWQLELIISGFAIYGLSQAIAPLTLYRRTFISEGQGLLSMVLLVALISCTILMTTLIFHVTLRGLWIGALGLRYVSGDIDYKKLNYTSKFDKHLRKRIGSFDKYISKLEDYCSIIFALSFLLVFYVISMFMCFGLLMLVIWLFLDFKNGTINNPILIIIGSLLLLIILFGILLILIDFLTQGFLKKKKWTAFIYFPFYWVFSFITLSFLYKPLVHNFLDNKFGKRLSLILIPIYILIFFLTTLNYSSSNYISADNDSSDYFADKYNYENLITKKGEFIKDVSIPSKVIEKSYLNIFIAFSDKVENTIFDFNETLRPDNDIRGIGSDFEFKRSINTTLEKLKKDSLNVEYLNTLKKIYLIKIDSTTYTNNDFVFTTNKLNQLGFETIINIKDLKEGKHFLNIERTQKYKRTDSIFQNKIATIPFWYYKQ